MGEDFMKRDYLRMSLAARLLSFLQAGLVWGIPAIFEITSLL